jgi:hypothetical protein
MKKDSRPKKHTGIVDRGPGSGTLASCVSSRALELPPLDLAKPGGVALAADLAEDRAVERGLRRLAVG